MGEEFPWGLKRLPVWTSSPVRAIVGNDGSNFLYFSQMIWEFFAIANRDQTNLLG